MKKSEREKLVHKVFSGFISKQKNLEVRRVSYPDEKCRTEKDVDVLIKHKYGEIVIEHTRIESYPDQINDWKKFEKLLYPLQKELDGKLPRGYYELYVKLGSVKGAKKTKEIQVSLKKWIKQQVHTFTQGHPGIESKINAIFSNEEKNAIPKHYITERPNGVPFEVTLLRWPAECAELDKKLVVISEEPNNLEEKRKIRIRTAMQVKCPKLLRRKKETKNGISILLLEFDDISLGNYHRISEALKEEIKERDDIPDEIYLLRTGLDEWMVYIFKEKEWVYQKGANIRLDCIVQTKIRNLVSYIEKFEEK